VLLIGQGALMNQNLIKAGSFDRQNRGIDWK